MTIIKRAFFRFKALLFGASKQQELEDEVRSHLDMQIEENINSGMSPEEARNTALREFGGIDQIKEECIDSWGVRIVNNFWQDVKFGIRQICKNKGFSIVVVLALSIGIGLVTTVFSIINGFMIKGLPFDESERIFYLRWDNVKSYGGNIRADLINVHDLNDFQEQLTTFEELCGSDNSTVNIKGDDYARRYNGCSISTNFLDLLRAKPLLGRGFFKDEDLPGADPVVIISYGIWQKDFYGDADIIGRSMLLNSVPHTIVGVMPQEFKFPQNAVLWFPMRKDFSSVKRKNSDRLSVYGRLKDSVTVEEALTELNGIATRLEQEYPDSNKGYNSIMIVPYIKRSIGDRFVKLLITMLLAAFMVLLIACSNVANLLFARSVLRSKELALKSAIGAPRKRIISQILTESLLITIIGAVGGFLIANIILDFLWNYLLVMVQGENYPSWVDFELDSVVLFFVISLTVLTGVISGIVPALQASKTDVHHLLKENARTSSSLRSGRFSKFLVIVQITLSCGLLIGSGLVLKLMFNLSDINLPYDPEKILTAHTSLFDTDYPDHLDKITFLKTLKNNLKAIPGIEAVAFTTSPLEPLSYSRLIEIDGVSYVSEDDYPRTQYAGISDSYFNVFGVSILEGRSFNDTDISESQQVAIINTLFADKYWPDQSPIGKRFKAKDPGEKPWPWLTVVGVVPDLQMEGLNTVYSDGSGFYVPMAQKTGFFQNITARHITLVLRGIGGDPMNWLPTVREELQKLNPNQPLYDIRTIQDAIDKLSKGLYFFFGLFVLFGMAAFLLAAIGVYGVMSFSVNQRTHEIGIRKALGAEPYKIMAMIIRQSSVQISTGIFFGLLFALALSRILNSIIDEEFPNDITVYLAVIVLITLVGLFAAWIPARLAARVDPIKTIRYE